MKQFLEVIGNFRTRGCDDILIINGVWLKKE